MRIHRFLIAIVILGACAPTVYPRKPDLPREMPPVEMGTIPPEPGMGQVVLDTGGESMVVEEVLASEEYRGTSSGGGITVSSYGYGEKTATVCNTPCVANLKYGTRALKFMTSNPEDVTRFNINVTTKPMVHRVNKGRTRKFIGKTLTGILLATIGGTSTLTTGLFAGIYGGGALIGATLLGGAVTVAGGVMLHQARTQITPGSIVTFPVDQ